jgi:hypothetical protein
MSLLRVVWDWLIGPVSNPLAPIGSAVTELATGMQKFGGAIDPVGVNRIFAAYQEELRRSNDLEKAVEAANKQLESEREREAPVFTIVVKQSNSAHATVTFKGNENPILDFDKSNNHIEETAAAAIKSRDLGALIKEGKPLELKFVCSADHALARLETWIEDAKGDKIRGPVNLVGQNDHATWEPPAIPISW